MRRFVILVALAVSASATATVGVSPASAGVLSVEFAGSGHGTVASSPAGINCSNVPGSTATDCSHDYGFIFDTGTLTATPAEGDAFVAWSGTVGGTCTGATNPCTTAILLLDQTAKATFAPKPAAPAVSTGSVSEMEFPSATVTGTVNPGSADFAISECHFEYGLTADYGDTMPCRPGSIGAGTSPVAVSASLRLLDPGKVYHYRLVASNGGGTARGEDRTFTSAAAPADDCPNAAIRAQQGPQAQRLPHCYAYEMVSPSFTGGQPAAASVLGLDGDRAEIQGAGGFADVLNLPDTGVQYLANRTASGWKTTAIAPPAKDFPFINSGLQDWSRDGARSLWYANLKVDEGTERFTPIVRDPDGSFHVAGVTQTEGISGGNSGPVSTSADLSTLLQATTTRPALTDGTTDSRSSSWRSLYASTRGPDGQVAVRQIAYRAGATMFPDCEVGVGGTFASGEAAYGRNAMSGDGQKIFFTTHTNFSGGPQEDPVCSSPEVRRVWAKVGANDPIDLSASQCPDTCGPAQTAHYRGAARDGSRVYFTTQQRLMPEDEDTSDQNDVYEYDFNATGQKLRLVTGGADPDGAGVLGNGIFRVSPDGAYVYFMASGRALTGPNARGASPQLGTPNLYVYHRAAGQSNGTTTFIGTLGFDFTEGPTTNSTGRYFLFQTDADLTGERLAGDTQQDAYRYDAANDELRRVWTADPTHNGSARVDGGYVYRTGDAPVGVPSGGSQSVDRAAVQMSDDGSLVGITTQEPLSADDRNTRTDGYLWEASTGRFTLLTDGSPKAGNQFAASRFASMTPSGDSLFVTSSAPLVGAHTSGQNAAYVLRRDGGFLNPAPPVGPCAGDECQGRPAERPALAGGATGDDRGQQNVTSDPPAPAVVSVSAPKSVRGSQVKVKVKVPGKGRISLSGSSVGSVQRTTAKVGTYTITVKLSPRAAGVLRAKKQVKAKLKVVFRSAGGPQATKTVSVTFKQPATKKQAKAKKKTATKSSARSILKGGR